MANNPKKKEFFPNLNETHVQGFAQQVVKRFSDIPIIEVSLHHYANLYFPDKEMPTKYTMTFKVENSVDGKALDTFRFALGEYSTLKDTSTFHELTGGRSFSMLYLNGVAPEGHLMEWRFIALIEGQEAPEGVLIDAPRWILYQKEDLKLQRFIEKVKPEIELLYQVIKTDVGFSGRNYDENPDESRRDAALVCFDENRKQFSLMTRDVLEDRKIYSARDGKHSMDIKSQILHRVVAVNGYGSISPSKLWSQYQKIRSI